MATASQPGRSVRQALADVAEPRGEQGDEHEDDEQRDDLDRAPEEAPGRELVGQVRHPAARQRLGAGRGVGVAGAHRDRVWQPGRAGPGGVR